MGQTPSNLITNNTILGVYDQVDLKSEYGTIVAHKTTKQTYLFKEINFPDRDDYKKALKHYEAIKTKPFQNVLNLIQLENQSKSMFCSQIYRLSLVYEFSQITLAQQIEARKPDLRYFQEQDLWSIIQSSLYGMIEVQQNILLQPNRIYIMSDGVVKIVDPDILTNNSWYMLDENMYYSPERFESFGSSNKTSIQEQQTLFALGATLLHTSILEDCFDCYEYGSHKFNQKRLNRKLEKLGQLYSEDLKMVICGLLQCSPQQRISAKQLQQIIIKVTVQQTQQQTPYESQQQTVSASKQQPFKQLRNDNHFTSERQLPINYSQNINKSKHCDIKTSLEPIVEYNPTRQNTKFQPTIFSNYKQIQQSQYQSIYHPPTSQFVQNVSIPSHASSSFDTRLDSSKSNNKFIQQSKFFEKKQYRYEVIKKQNDENLFTDPRLLEQIRKDMCQITSRRSLASSAYPSARPSYFNQKVTTSYVPQTQNINGFVKKSKIQHKQQRYYQEDGKIFEGVKINEMKQGFGKLTYPEGPFYLGQFVDDKMHGKGVLYYEENKPAYDGEWFQDQFHGKGKLYNQNPLQQNEPFDYRDFNLVEDYWVRYEGDFVQDNKQGFGKLFLSNDEVFEGNFQKDCINGQGTFYNKFGEKQYGIWKQNILEDRQ